MRHRRTPSRARTLGAVVPLAALLWLILASPAAMGSTIWPAASNGSSGLTAQTLAIVTTIGSLVVPPVTSFLKRETWAVQIKQLVAAILSLAVAAAALAITAPHDFALPLLSVGALIYAGSQGIYGVFFHGSVVDTALTSVGKRKAAKAAPAASAEVAPKAASAAASSAPVATTAGQ